MKMTLEQLREQDLTLTLADVIAKRLANIRDLTAELLSRDERSADELLADSRCGGSRAIGIGERAEMVTKDLADAVESLRKCQESPRWEAAIKEARRLL